MDAPMDITSEALITPEALMLAAALPGLRPKKPRTASMAWPAN